MGLYRKADGTMVDSTVPVREDIERYQTELSQYLSQFRQERQEVDAMMSELRELQYSYQTKIKEQDEKIHELTLLVIRLSNKVGGE